jgi:hypothetical protein
LQSLDYNFTQLQQDKERLQSFYAGLELENKHLSSLKDDNIRFSEENDRLRAHYEVLKEHELNIIKDYEAKI